MTSWWQVGFLAALLVAALGGPAAWDRYSPAARALRAAARRDRAAERARARTTDDAQQRDLDAIHRHYRTQVRLYLAGHHPDLAGPVHLASAPPPATTRPVALPRYTGLDQGRRPPNSAMRYP